MAQCYMTQKLFVSIKPYVIHQFFFFLVTPNAQYLLITNPIK